MIAKAVKVYLSLQLIISILSTGTKKTPKSSPSPTTKEITFNKNKTIDCEATENPTKTNNCTQHSDDFINCCYLSTTADNPQWGTSLCMPIRPQTTPYNKLKVIFGVGFIVGCSPPLKSLPSNLYSNTPEKYSSCGPARPKNLLDCLPYSLKDNTCCMATYLVDTLSITVNQCFYFGSKYNQELRNQMNKNTTIKIGKTNINCDKFYISYSFGLLVILLFFTFLI